MHSEVKLAWWSLGCVLFGKVFPFKKATLIWGGTFPYSSSVCHPVVREGKMLADLPRYPYAILVSWAAVKCQLKMDRDVIHCFSSLAELPSHCKLSISSPGFVRSQHRSSGHGRRLLQKLERQHKSSLFHVMCCYITDTLPTLPTTVSPKAGQLLRVWKHMAVWNRYKYKKKVSAKGESRLDIEMVPGQQPIYIGIDTNKFYKDGYRKLTRFPLGFKANKKF